MFTKNTRAGILLVAAGYLIYLAVDLFKGRNAPGTTMKPWLAVLFAVIFIIAATGILVFAFKLWKKKEDNNESTSAQKESNSLK